jgi:uncharacterized sulfatase
MKSSRRELLSLPVAAPLLTRAYGRAVQPNVLMFAVDDLNTRIGCYGDPVVKTPNLARLATRGVRFERAYCNYPLCNPSRTSLLSGRRPENTGVYDNPIRPRSHLGGALFLPEYFKANGYFTARVGKVAHWEDDVHWDISEGPPAPQTPPPVIARNGSLPGKNGMRRINSPHAPSEGIGNLMWMATDNPDEKEPDGATARRIAQIITEKKERPFFIACGFSKPHLPWVAPRKYFDAYDLKNIQLPKTPAGDLDDIPPTALVCTNSDDLTSDEDRRKAILAYYASTSFMDAQLGVVLDALDRHGLWDNTVVLLWADHGWHLYDHTRLWGKMTLFEEAAHTPLILHAPNRPEGTVCRRLVEWVDIYPTLAELCGLRPNHPLDGTSFAPLLSDPGKAWKKAAYTTVARAENRFGHSVRTERFRYTEWDGGKDGLELYDHDGDEHEWTNLAGNPKFSAVQKNLEELLRASKTR